MILIIEIDCLFDDIDILQILRELLVGKYLQIVVDREELGIWQYFGIFGSFFPVEIAHYELSMRLSTHSNGDHITFFCESLSIMQDSFGRIFSSISFPIFCCMILGVCLALDDYDIVHIPLWKIHEKFWSPDSFSSF